jgi:hypothetical protein
MVRRHIREREHFIQLSAIVTKYLRKTTERKIYFGSPLRGFSPAGIVYFTLFFSELWCGRTSW